MLFPQNQTLQTPGADRITALLHLRITQHSPSLPWMTTSLPGSASHKDKSAGELDSSAVKEHNHCICVHSGMQSSNSTEVLALPSLNAHGLACQDLVAGEDKVLFFFILKTPQVNQWHSKQSYLFI